jgi:hypothetical protein
LQNLIDEQLKVFKKTKLLNLLKEQNQAMEMERKLV